MNKFKFGDKVLFISHKVKDLKTPCLFIRYENNKCVIMFENAEWSARVCEKDLETKQITI